MTSIIKPTPKDIKKRIQLVNPEIENIFTELYQPRAASYLVDGILITRLIRLKAFYNPLSEKTISSNASNVSDIQKLLCHIPFMITSKTTEIWYCLLKYITDHKHVFKKNIKVNIIPYIKTCIHKGFYDGDIEKEINLLPEHSSEMNDITLCFLLSVIDAHA